MFEVKCESWYETDTCIDCRCVPRACVVPYQDYRLRSVATCPRCFWGARAATASSSRNEGHMQSASTCGGAGGGVYSSLVFHFTFFLKWYLCGWIERIPGEGPGEMTVRKTKITGG